MDITNKQNCLSVRMLGDFSVTANNVELTVKSARSVQIWTLFKYLVLNRKSPVPVKALIDLLWDEGECENPVAALYTLIYRLRSLLNKHLSTPQKFFEFNLNSYIWNDESSIEIDCEQFKLLYIKGCSEKNTTKAIELLKSAVELYKGDLFLDSNESPWHVIPAENYRVMYINTVTTLCELLISQGDYASIPLLCGNAVKIDRFCEEFYYYLILSLLKLKRNALARRAYDYAMGVMVNELGTNISDRISLLMNQHFSGDELAELSIDKIAKLLGNDDSSNLPFICDINTFRRIFLLARRMSARTKTPFCLVSAIVVSDKVLISENPLSFVMDAMATNVNVGIRCSDVIAQYSHKQILFILTNSSYENTKSAMKRFAGYFSKCAETTSIKFKFSIKLFN